MKISSVSYNCNYRLVANSYYNPRISQFYATDPLAEKYYFQSPYTYATNNPVGLVDVDGLGTNENEDWIKNKKTGEYKWDNNVTKESETPEGYKYIGKKDSDIIFDLFGTNYFKTKTWDYGSIGFEDFNNPYSATGFAITQFYGKTTMRILAYPEIDISLVNGEIQKTFKGVNIQVSTTGNLVIAPTYSVPEPLKVTKFYVENISINNRYENYINYENEMYNPNNYSTGYFKTFIPASDIINKCGYFDIKLKGIYNVNNTYLRQPSVFSLSGVANHTYLKKTIYFNN